MNHNQVNLSLFPEQQSEMEPTAQRSQKTPSAQEQNPIFKYLPVYHIELVRERSIKVDSPAAIHSPDDVVAILKDELLSADREKLVCLWLNTKHVVAGIEIVSVGTLSASMAHPREIFKGAILKNAAAILLCHNHPSGGPSPSSDDIRLTERIAEAGKLLGIELLDHVILGHHGHYSFKSAGRLP